MIRIYPQHLEAFIAAADEKDGRAGLTALYIRHEAGETVAVSTDSCQLMEVRTPQHEDDRETDETKAGYMVPGHVVKIILDAFKATKKQSYGYAKNLAIIEAKKFTTVFGEMEYMPIEAQFPKYASLLENTREASTVRVNPRYLGNLAKFMKGDLAVEVETCGKTGPVVYTAECASESTKKVMLIMPLRK